MVVGSDGRYFSRAAIEVIVQMAAANGVRDPGDQLSVILPTLKQLQKICGTLTKMTVLSSQALIL